VGAAHIAIHLVGFARSLGFETIVIDPRESYAREDRFPNPPDALICEWPKQALEKYSITGSDCLAAMTHDPKIDDEALNVFLRSDTEYIGALGSRKSHAARLKRLGKLGFKDDSFSRIHAPIGIDIGSETPAEIALSVMAEIVKKSHQKHSVTR
jgi:xanthine dehydrogenase accessory factor